MTKTTGLFQSLLLRSKCLHFSRQWTRRRFFASSSACRRRLWTGDRCVKDEFGGLSMSPKGFNQRLSTLVSNYSATGEPKASVPVADEPADNVEKKTNYESVLSELYSLHHLIGTVKMGLGNVKTLDSSMNYPSRKIKVIHVAGTNGKGSTCWKIACALEALGFKVGLFVSPHISCFRERVRVNGDLISEDKVVHLFRLVQRISKENRIMPTFFEYVTMMAFQHFANENVDYAVIETGLGGRLDSTNVVQSPILTIVTNIGLEHTRILGSTIEDIAREKLHIAKPETPMLIGENVPYNVATEICSKIGSPLHVMKKQVIEENDYNKLNARLATKALELLGIDCSKTNVQKALLSRTPCRFEVVRKPSNMNSLFVLDAAHNVPALAELFRTLRKELPKLQSMFSECDNKAYVSIVFAVSDDKDQCGCMDLIRMNSDILDQLIVTEAHTSRAKNAKILVDAFHNSKVSMKQSPSRTNSLFLCSSSTVSDALALTCEKQKVYKNCITIVCGTLFMMAEARKWLNLTEYPVDPSGILHKPKN